MISSRRRFLPFQSARTIASASLPVACVVLAALAGCSAAPGRVTPAWRESSQTVQTERAEQSVVEADSLARLYRDGTAGVVLPADLVVLDVRAPEAFEAGHLPGAVRVEYAEWELAARGEGIGDASVWHQRFGALGIGADDRVLVYDDGRMTSAARIWFIMQHHGVPEAMVVNGGFPAIERADASGTLGIGLERRPAAAPRPDRFEPSADAPSRIGLADREQVRQSIERGEAQILDVRTLDEYTGKDLKSNTRGGHLPSAVNVDHKRMLGPDGRLLDRDELAGLLEQAGLERGRPVITHCQSGGRAALAALAAARAGYGPVVNYYASFGDWAADASCPLVDAE